MLMLVCALLAPLAAPAQAETDGWELPMASEAAVEEHDPWEQTPVQEQEPEEETSASSEISEAAGEESPTPSPDEESTPPPETPQEPVEPEPPAEEVFPVVTVPAENYSIVNIGFNNKSLFLRSAPSTSASRLLLPFATERAFVRETLANGWSRVIVRGTEGYLPTQYVKDNCFPLYLKKDYTIDGVELKEDQWVYARSRDGQNVYDCYTDADISQHLLLNGALLMTPQEYYEKNADKLVPVLIGKEESYYSLNSANWGRNVNLELGCQSVDGRVILPAEYFSWCQHGGSGSKADGYQLATVFSSTGYDYGGGLCQVTTTLASAADYAKMYLAEVYVHSQPVTYLRPGMREASIWRNGNIRYQHDFAFFNNRMNPIQIRMKAENGVVTAELYELVLPPSQEEPAKEEPAPAEEETAPAEEETTQTETTQAKDEASQ